MLVSIWMNSRKRWFVVCCLLSFVFFLLLVVVCWLLGVVCCLLAALIFPKWPTWPPKSTLPTGLLSQVLFCFGRCFGFGFAGVPLLLLDSFFSVTLPGTKFLRGVTYKTLGWHSIKWWLDDWFMTGSSKWLYNPCPMNNQYNESLGSPMYWLWCTDYGVYIIYEVKHPMKSIHNWALFHPLDTANHQGEPVTAQVANQDNI